MPSIYDSTMNPQSYVMPGYSVQPQYPYAYSPASSYTMPMNLPSQQRSSSSIVWVQGEAGAKAYPVAPGNTVLLMDSETNQFYIKSLDASGKPTTKTYVYEEKANETEKVTEDTPQNDFVTRKEFAELKKQLDDLMSQEQQDGKVYL